MSASTKQKQAFTVAFIAWAEQTRRIMEQGASLRDQNTDLGIGAALTDADINGIPDLAGISAADVNAALAIAGQMIGEFTAARRAAFNKIGHGAP